MNKLQQAAIAAALSITSAAAYAQMPQQPQPIQERMQQIIAAQEQSKSFSGSVLVVKDGVILIDQGYGAADLEWKIPNSPAVRFRLGSLTKQFTSASILLLEQRGKLKVTDPISTYLPDSPAAWSKITIADLLRHSSGIPNFTSFPDYAPTEWKDTTPAELVARFRNKALDFEPGTKFSYSNSGYVLLGYLLEKISGQTYAAFLQQNIFNPLAMADTGVDSTASIIPGRAQGYWASPGSPTRHATYTSMTIPFSAGALYSTTGDLFKWEQALFAGKVINPEEFKKMTTPYKENYAFGLINTKQLGHPVIWHNGGIEGFVTYLAYYPADHLTVVVLSNNEAANADQLGQQLGRLALGGEVKLAAEHKEVSIAPALLADYAGVYRFSPKMALTITVADGALSGEMTGQNALRLFPESETKFFLKAVDAQVQFNRASPAGKVTSVTLFQGGHEQQALRE